MIKKKYEDITIVAIIVVFSRIRGRLHVYESVYDFAYDFKHDLYASQI
jgi:hypothetical protein